MTMKYSCNQCGIERRSLEVRERAPDEDVVNYVHHCGNQAGRDHAQQSPHCWASQLSELMIPASQSGVGVVGESLNEDQIKRMNEVRQ